MSANSGTYEVKNTRNSIRLAAWTAAWVLTMAVASMGPDLLWQSRGIPTLAAILVNLAIGIGMIMAMGRYLKGLDELQQKIQLEAMGLSLGVGLVAGMAYVNFDQSGLIASHADISHLVMLMAVTYIVGIVAGSRKYK